MHVIVGENASGKTLYLKNLLNEKDSVVSNIREDILEYTRKYNQERLDVLADYLVADVTVVNGVVDITDSFIPFSEEFRREALKLCKEGDYLILDEPDAKLTKMCGNMLYAFVKMLIPTYRDCYVATHKQCLIGESFCVCYKVDKKGSLIKIEDREAYEYVD